MLTTLFTWWKQQVRDLIPASARRSWRRAIIVVVAGKADAPTVELFLQGRGGETALGTA